MTTGFIVRRLTVRRFLGISDRFELNDLAAGVNLVFGPNGSGKTTTAKALEALVWPRSAAPAGAALEATVEVGSERWGIRLDAGLVEHQQNGVPSAAPPTASSEGRDRYRLWLPDLLRAEDAGFARAILIESSGGFDLEEAARVLERRRPSHRQRSQQVELRRARERVQSARAVQAALAEENARLASKEGRLAARPELEARVHLVTVALEYAERRAEAEALRQRLAGFPGVLARLRGDEADRLANLRVRTAEASARREAAERERADILRQTSRVSLPPTGLDATLLHRLSADVDRLIELDREIAEHERLCAGAATRLQEEEASLPGVTDRNRLSRLDLPALAAFERVAEAAETIRQERHALEAELGTLPDEDPQDDVDRLHHGLSLLRQWLAADPPETAAVERVRYLAAGGGAATGLAGLVFLFLGHFLAGVAFLVLAAILVLLIRRTAGAPSLRPAMEREYLRLGLLLAPDVWDTASVESCRHDLEERIQRARSLDRAAERRQLLQRRLAELRDLEPPVEADVQRVAEEVGLSPGSDAIRLLWLVQRISRWQRARIDRAAAESALVEGCRAQRELLEQLNARLEPLGFEPFTESRAARAAVEKVRQDAATHERLARAAETAMAAIERETAEIERLGEEVGAILARAWVDPDDEARLSEWCALVDDFRSTTAMFEAAEAQRRRIEERLREQAAFEQALLSTPPESLQRRRAELERELAALHELAEEVGSLRARVESAKHAHSLEDALADEARCRDALLELRSRELRAAVAAVLVDHVERETRNEHLPEVFHRANQLFTLITRGAYELRIGMGESPTFRAFDTRSERGHPLDELSSGTRVQLLLAVRIAFVEAGEAGVALPLLMDETLANSDDERAAAIMDAVIELSAGGRQIFYFTAQPDEVAKWRRSLDRRSDVAWALFDLAEVRRLEQRLDSALLEATIAAQPPAPIVPAGLAHSEYVEALAVPAVDLTAPVGSLHLWYLVEEPAVLHGLLTGLRLERWAELNALVAGGGGALIEPAALERIRSSARVAAAILIRLRVGRGRPVDRSVLVASGVVSDRFIDEVDALCRGVTGDGARLVDLLEERAVPGFFRRNVEALRSYLEEEGFLDRRGILRNEAIRHEVIAENSDAIRTGKLTIEEIDRLLVRLVAGAGCGSPPEARREVPQPQLWPEPLA